MLNSPPEDQLRALTDLLYRTILEIRVEALQGKSRAGGELRERFSKIVAYTDAIHNLPGFLADYDDWNQDYFEAGLEDADAAGGINLPEIYRHALKQARSGDGEAP